MPASVAKSAKDERLELRLTKDAKRILQQAAAVRHKSLSEFVTDSSITAAYDTLADRRLFILDDKQWDAFMKALDAPPKPNPRLRKLMSRTPAWKR
jgi:uncharacterized protein (DUF1778 family)